MIRCPLAEMSAVTEHNLSRHSPAPLTDNAFIDLILSDSGTGCHRNPGYWKLNCSLLQIPSYCLGIKSIIEEFKAKPGVSISSNWEMFKYECRKFSIRFSKQLARAKSLKYTSVLSEINQILGKQQTSEDDKVKLHNLKEDLNNFYAEKAKGAFIRSRVKWLEFGEKNSAYFFNLEKKRGISKKIFSLNIEGNLVTDEVRVSNFVSNFYSQLNLPHLNLSLLIVFLRGFKHSHLL